MNETKEYLVKVLFITDVASQTNPYWTDFKLMINFPMEIVFIQPKIYEISIHINSHKCVLGKCENM